jgi:hypothetical protein
MEETYSPKHHLPHPHPHPFRQPFDLLRPHGPRTVIPEPRSICLFRSFSDIREPEQKALRNIRESTCTMGYAPVQIRELCDCARSRDAGYRARGVEVEFSKART